MRWLVIILLLSLALPAAAMFDFHHESPNHRYQVLEEKGQLLLKDRTKVLWRRPCAVPSLGLQVSNQGQVCLHQSGSQLFLDSRGRDLVRVESSTWGWFSRDGASYFAYLPGQPALQELPLRPGSSYHPVDHATLLAQTAGPKPAYVLCEVAGRGLEIPEKILARMPPGPASWWRHRLHPDPKAPLEAWLCSPPEVYWRRARSANFWEIHGTLPCLLLRRGRPALQATARQLPDLDPARLECVLQSLASEGPIELGPLRPVLEKIATAANGSSASAISLLAQGQGLRSALRYLHTPAGRGVLLLQLARVRQGESIPLLLDLLEKHPRDERILQALRFQCRVGLPADPKAWREWCSTSHHSLEDRLSVQSRRQLRGFLLASWNGLLIREDFTRLPRLVKISETRWGMPSLNQPKLPGGWGAIVRLPLDRGFLAWSSPGRVCLLDPKGQRLTPDRPLGLSGAFSPNGTYLIEQGPQISRLQDMLSGREVRLPEGGLCQLAFSPDERFLAVAGGDSLRYYHLPSCRLEAEVPFGSMQSMRWQGSDLILSDNGLDYRFRLDDPPGPEALEGWRQRLLAEVWTGYRLQGGAVLRLTPDQWRNRLDRLDAPPSR